jgi:putative transposase
MRALDYPGRGTLTAWVREAIPEARRAVVGIVGRRRYSGKLMQAGVMELCTREKSAQAVADNSACADQRCTTGGTNFWGVRHPHP